MKWFLRKDTPPIQRLLLVESGPRKAAQRLVPYLRSNICGDVPIDLFTYLPDDPPGLGTGSRTWRTYDARSYSERWKMLLGLRKEGHAAAAVLCADSPLLAVWKLVLIGSLPAKILLVDETEGSFWLDRSHWRRGVAAGNLAKRNSRPQSR